MHSSSAKWRKATRRWIFHCADLISFKGVSETLLRPFLFMCEMVVKVVYTCLDFVCFWMSFLGKMKMLATQWWNLHIYLKFHCSMKFKSLGSTKVDCLSLSPQPQMGTTVNPSFFQFPSWQNTSYDSWPQAVETSMRGRLASPGFRLSCDTN